MDKFFIDSITTKNGIWVTSTDLEGKITYVNDSFCEITGYSRNEVIGKNHSILRHPDMSDTFFKEMWATLNKRDKWAGCIKNLRKDKTEYVVYVEIKTIFVDKIKVGYKSKRTMIQY
jgi:PAS domain S-box-containing protein